MNVSHYKLEELKKLSERNNHLWIILKKFWRFSLFYGEYLASFHGRKDG